MFEAKASKTLLKESNAQKEAYRLKCTNKIWSVGVLGFKETTRLTKHLGVDFLDGEKICDGPWLVLFLNGGTKSTASTEKG